MLFAIYVFVHVAHSYFRIETKRFYFFFNSYEISFSIKNFY